MQNENEKPENHTRQCKTCKHTGTRACMYHGYPETEIPPSCAYKLGTNAEEAMRNLTGTFIDVWSPEHETRFKEKILHSCRGHCRMATKEDYDKGTMVVSLLDLAEVLK